MKTPDNNICFKNREQVLNFFDAVIYGSDLALVQSQTAWLNDAIIHFYFNVLDQRQKKKGKRNCLFMDPSIISFFMHQVIDEDDINEFKSSANFPSEDGLIFIPVNDNMRANADWMIPGSGSHWSLLVVFLGRGDVQFWHFDSVKSIKNSRAAKDIMKKVSTILQSTYTPLSLNLVNAFTPQQKNGFDCGVHMLVAAKVFSTMTTTTRGKKLQDYENVILEFAKANPDFCGSLRQEIVGEIIRLATMGKQR